MPAARRRAPRAITAAVAACTLSLATAAPGLARPAGHGPARPCVGCDAAATGTTGAGGRDSESPRTSSLAGTVDPRRSVIAASPAPSRGIDAPDGGATTFAVVLIAGGALLAGGAAGFAGSRRVFVRAG
jgi:hypothetical protein